jgi:choline dehydrogenase-like flavoprotein
LNATVALEPAPLAAAGQSTFQWATPDVVDRMRTDRVVPDDAQSTPRAPRTFHLLTRQEQAPNPASRVTLSGERDALGMPRARLDWRLTPLDRRSFRGFYEALGRELGRAGIGRLQMNDWVMQAADAPWPKSLGGGWHHMGTTRMHPDPKQGVVDVNCRVHGIGNLYVAGAAVYPTAGCVNPTLTLVALTLRLADHLQRGTPR